jgi:hypothetical protein
MAGNGNDFNFYTIDFLYTPWSTGRREYGINGSAGFSVSG